MSVCLVYQSNWFQNPFWSCLEATVTRVCIYSYQGFDWKNACLTNKHESQTCNFPFHSQSLLFTGIWPRTLRRRPTSARSVRKCSTAKTTWRTTCRPMTPTKRPSSVRSVGSTTTPSWDTSAMWPCTPPRRGISPVKCACRVTRARLFSWSTLRATLGSPQPVLRRKNTHVTTVTGVSTHGRMWEDTWWSTQAERTSYASTVLSVLAGRTIWRAMWRRATRRSCWRLRQSLPIC